MIALQATASIVDLIAEGIFFVDQQRRGETTRWDLIPEELRDYHRSTAQHIITKLTSAGLQITQQTQFGHSA